MKKKELSARILSLALSVVMVCAMLPATAFAAEDTTGTTVVAESAYDKVLDLFTALPTASSINRTTTEEEKDAIIAQLNEAMEALYKLTADEQTLFMKEQLELYKAAMALNDVITGASPMTLANVVIPPPFVEGTNKRYKSGEIFKATDLKVGDRIEVGAICNEAGNQLNFDSYELALTGGMTLTAGPSALVGVGNSPVTIKDRYENNNNQYTGGATHVSTRTEWVMYDGWSANSPYFTAADKSILAEYDVTVAKTGLTGAAAKFEIELAEGNKLVEGDSFKVADYDTLLVTLTPNGGGSFETAPTVTVDSGATAGTVTKGTGEEYTCEITSFTGNTTITIAGTAGGASTSVDKTALSAAVTAATTNKNAVETSTDGKDVDPSNKWVTAAVKTAYETAIAAAQAVIDNTGATQADVNAAVTALAAATTTFDNAKADGTKPAPVTKYAITFANPTNGTLAATVDGNTITSGNEVESGKTVTFTVTPNSGYEVDTWSGATAGTPNTTATLTVSAAATVSVTLKAIPTDKTALTTAITAATTNKDSVETSTDGKDVDPSKKWVTAAVKTAYNNAITAAQTVANKTGATQAEIDAAVTALAAATTTFNNAKADGTKPAPVTKYAITFANPTNGTLAATVDGSTITSGTEVESGKTVTFTVTPNSGYEVDTWSGATAGTPNTKATLTVSAAATVSVTLKATPADKTALTTAITAATTNKDSVETSTDGKDVDTSKKWVTAAVKTAYNNAITAAQTVANKTGATQAEIDAAVTALATATTTFNNAKADGTKPAPVTKYAITFANPINGTLTATVDGSAITTGTEVATGKIVTFTVTPNSGYEVNAWSGATAGTPNTTATLTVSAAATVSVSLKAVSETDQQIADRVAALITSITAPDKDATTLTLPTVSDGCTIAIKSSSNEAVISLNGTITPPDAETEVTLVLTVTKGSATADTISIKVKVPAKSTATPDKTALNTAITEANNAKSGIATNNASDPSSVSNGIKYVSDTEMKALTDAIAAGQTVANNANATTADITAAVNALKSAVDTFKAAIKTGTSTSGGGGGGTTTPPTNPNPPTVDGKPQDIGKTETKDNTTTVTIDSDKLDKSLESAKDGSKVTVPVSTTKDSAAAQLTAESLEKLADKNMTLEVTSGKTSYTLPAASVDMNSVLNQLGATDASKVPFTVTITNEKNAKVEGATLVVPPVSFTVTATYNGKSVTVDSFSSMVARTLELTKEQASKITTAVVIENGKIIRHVPTYVYEQGGKYYAKINSMTNSTYAIIANENAFTDTTEKWYEAAANELSAREITKDIWTTSFEGDKAITRAEFAALIVNALGLPKTVDAKFSDVSADAWYSKFVATASEYGIVSGYTDGSFKPNATITRQEAMVMMARAAKVAEYAGGSAAIGRFPDYAQVGAWAKDGVDFNLKSGLIVGKSNGTLDLTGNITRGETATVILRLLQNAELVDVRAKV